MSDLLNERFTKDAAAWDNNPIHAKTSKAALDAILQYVPGVKNGNNDGKGLDVLEIGCGTGLMSFMIAPHVHTLIGVDTASGMTSAFNVKLTAPSAPTHLATINKLLEDPDDPELSTTSATLYQARSEPAPPTPVRFDLVTSHLVLHHIPDLKDILKLMFGCLKSGGRIALTDFEDTGPDAVLFHPKSKREGVERHGIEPKEMEGLIKEAGFEDVSVKRYFELEKGVEEMGPEGKMMFPFVICLGRKP